MNLYRIKKMITYIPRKVINRLNPVKYAKMIGVHMGQNIHIYGHVDWSTEPFVITLGNNVHITNDVSFTTHDGGTLLFRNKIPDLEITKPITVGDHVYIGTRSMIMPGVTIGSHVIIAAGSIVTKDVPDDCVYGGVPAKYIKSIDEYFEKIQNESLHIGHLPGLEKEKKLKELFDKRTK